MKINQYLNNITFLLIFICFNAISCLKIPISSTIEILFDQEVVASNPMKKDEVWTNTRTINLKSEMEKRGISTTSLKKATVLGSYFIINKVRCEQVENVSATVNGFGLTNALFGYDTNKCTNHALVTNQYDITNELKNGTNITILYSVKAKSDFTAAHGFTAYIALQVEYLNKT
jgi:hypothetical protein